MTRERQREGGQRVRTSAAGFTLFELLVSLIVLAVLLAIAVPNLSAFVSSSRLRASQSELVSALTLARSEATKRGVNVGVETLDSAPVAGLEFNAGWRVFVDANGDGVYNAGPPAEAVVREYPPVAGNFRFGTESGAVRAVFNSRGFLTTGGELVFKVCGKPGVTKGYRVRLEPVGIADVVEGESCS